MEGNTYVPLMYEFGWDRVTDRNSMCEDLGLKHPFSCVANVPTISDKMSFLYTIPAPLQHPLYRAYM